ncbi:MAG: type II toxin-antitoxin system Phd/YefM family antitoxin [Propionibacteriaceae bacterium]|jgi:antitoxin Phd|nr:type II toxin-antitoxin system Phd/YefM family antitoxin [Propionibacteriaceae bacterium]
MLVDTENLVSMSEANQNFSRVARMVDERGSVVILRNNVPRYVVLDFGRLQPDEAFDDADVARLGRALIARHRRAFDVLGQ